MSWSPEGGIDTAEMTKDLKIMLGNPRKAILAMAGPLLVAYLVIQLNTFLDVSWCSGLGSAASSSVASIAPLVWIVNGLGTGLGVGATAAIARRLGRGEKEKADSLASQTVVLAIVIGVAVVPVLYYLLDPMIYIMGVENILTECREYVCPIIAGTVVVVLSCMVTGLLRAEGAAKKATMVQISVAVIHMCLDPVFIYVLGLGLAGAAYAMVISFAASAVIGFYWYAAKKMYLTLSFRGFRVRKDECMDVLNVGVPRILELMIICVMAIVQRIFVTSCGGCEAVMFYNIPWNFITLAQSVSQSLGSALIPVCAAALAVGNRDKVADGYVYAFKLSLISMCIIALFLAVFSDYVVMIFTYQSDMVAFRGEFAHVLRIFTIVIPTVAMIDIGSSILQSLRKAQVSMYSAFVRNLILVVLVAWASTVSLDAIYWMLVVAETLGAVMMVSLAYKMFGYRFEMHPKKMA